MQKKGLNDNSDTLSYTKHKGHPQAGVENVKISSNFYHYGDEEVCYSLVYNVGKEGIYLQRTTVSLKTDAIASIAAELSAGCHT